MMMIIMIDDVSCPIGKHKYSTHLQTLYKPNQQQSTTNINITILLASHNNITYTLEIRDHGDCRISRKDE